MVVLPFLCIFFLLIFHGNGAIEIELPTAPNQSKLQTYIVHVENPKIRLFGESNDLEKWHRSFLPVTSEASVDVEQPRLLYSYQNVISGFSARLTIEQLKNMEEKDGFISAMPETTMILHTTHTPAYLGLNQESGLWKDSNFGEGVIIGVLDSGIHPNHSSFSDEGMPPPPAKWKGRCEFNRTSLCNNKLIGARSFNRASRLLNSPVDENGHGTHTASTAGGAFVENANALGNARGKAAGIAPLAHLAIYKVCGSKCSTSDVLAGIDAAIGDGVDVISMSLGANSHPGPFFKDNLAIGTFAAIQKGIFVSCAAGNAGPSNSTLSNEAPWILTVGASTVNRRIVAIAKLGNGEEYSGESLFQPSDFPSSKLFPLVYAGGETGENKTSSFCGEGSFTNFDVKGKIVVCEGRGQIGRTTKGKEVKKNGGVGMILINHPQDGFTTFSEAHVLPATHVSYEAGLSIKAYIRSSNIPMASISFKGTIIGQESSNDASSFAPAVASFSSRGPGISSPGILKPDITGPGVNILAAWPVSLEPSGDSRSAFNVISGTSMACPHLSGIAALIKRAHPKWSPAAIKSAIMTTANTTTPQGNPILDQDLNPANLFAIGAGHVNPSRAADPGLVYDIKPEDYIPYLCGLYKDNEVSIIVQKQVTCASVAAIREGDLNYPSFTVALGALQTFKRTVTNVGDAFEIYSPVVEAPRGVSVTVVPQMLLFLREGQSLSYWVSFRRIGSAKIIAGEFGEGYLKWVSRKHVVRSPISVKFV